MKHSVKSVIFRNAKDLQRGSLFKIKIQRSN